MLASPGVAKEFEIVDGVRRVIALDDEDPYDDEGWLDNDEWEAVDAGEQHAVARKSYSSILAGAHDRQ